LALSFSLFFFNLSLFSVLLLPQFFFLFGTFKKSCVLLSSSYIFGILFCLSIKTKKIFQKSSPGNSFFPYSLSFFLFFPYSLLFLFFSFYFSHIPFHFFIFPIFPFIFIFFLLFFPYSLLFFENVFSILLIFFII
jgi:hypothetical protein